MNAGPKSSGTQDAAPHIIVPFLESLQQPFYSYSLYIHVLRSI